MHNSVRRSRVGLVFATGALLPIFAASETVLAADSAGSGIAFASLRAGGPYSIESLRAQIGADLLLVGPVSAVNVRAGTGELLGQTVAALSVGERTLASLRPGSVVGITGRM